MSFGGRHEKLWVGNTTWKGGEGTEEAQDPVLGPPGFKEVRMCRGNEAGVSSPEPGGGLYIHPEGFQARSPGSTLGKTCLSSSLLVNPKVDKQFPVSLPM